MLRVFLCFFISFTISSFAVSSSYDADHSDSNENREISIKYKGSVLNKEIERHPDGRLLRRVVRGIGPILKEQTSDSLTYLVQGPTPKEGQEYAVFSYIEKLGKGDNLPANGSWAYLDSKVMNITHVSFMGLVPNSRYQIKFAFANADNIPSAFDIGHLPAIEVKTLPEKQEGPLSFIVFSCVNAFKAGPLSFGYKKVDRAWKNIRKNIEEYAQEDDDNITSAIIGLGDQVYQDKPLKIFRSESLEDFTEKYRRIYSTDNARAIFSTTQTIFLPDDHAVDNDSGSQDEYVKKYRDKYGDNHAKTHQAQDRFNNGMEAVKLIEFMPGDNGFFKGKIVMGLPFFIADLRRERAEAQEDPKIMSDAQMENMKSFIQIANEHDTLPVLLFSVPFSTQLGNGSWTDFETQQKEFLDFMSQGQYKAVIFSGDTHVGYTHVFQAYEANGKAMLAHPILEVTSSGLHAQSRKKAATTKSSILRTDYSLSSIAPISIENPTGDLRHDIIKQDTFARVSLSSTKLSDKPEITVTFFSARDGRELLKIKHTVE